MIKEAKVLLVDDYPLSLKLCRQYLEQAKFTVLVASGSQQCLELLELHSDIATVVVDIIMMPVNGFEVVQKIKANERTRQIPVAMMSIHHDSYTQNRCYASGADIFLPKPIVAEILCAKVETLCELYHLRQLKKT